LPEGTYFLVARGASAGQLDVSLSLSDPSSPPSNDTCASAADISGGGTFEGTLLCASADQDLSCDYWNGSDVAYVFTLDEQQDVELTLRPEDDLDATMAVATECGSAAAELSCQWGKEPHSLLRSLGPGTYSVLVAGRYQAAFELDVAFAPPTTACADARVISESTVVTDTTAGRPRDFLASCGGGAYGGDLPYIIDVPFEFDLTAELVSAPFDTVLHLRAACDDPASEIACNDNADVTTFLSRVSQAGLAAGTYVLVVDGYWDGAEGAFTLDIDITPR
jgi:hypothetical protein